MQRRAFCTITVMSCWMMLATAAVVRAQDKEPAPDAARQAMMQRAEQFRLNGVDRTYKLHNEPTPADQNEVLTALRNMTEPQVKIFLVPSQNMIVVHAPPELQEQIAKLIATLDQPHPRYRLTYTVTELDGTRKIGVQHYSMVLLDGQRTQMKEGSRIPIYTGDSPVHTYTYLDAGMNFDVTLTEVQGGGVLKSKVEQSSIAPGSETTVTNPAPVLRQTTIEGTTSLVINKPLLLGSLDVPASTHHFDIEVVMEPVN